MGNCCGSESHEVEGHQLTSTKNKSAGQTLGGTSPSQGGESREAMLSAAEKRRLQAENRGVKEGGKLSKQLAEQKKQNQPGHKDELDDRLVWD
ncbi:hypothetical protein BDF21DRAFT_409660 [Thamnidium elegans]|uniref:Small VCP/p97-interacting protein n=1 Tax=Thamnidium elegans TaxID=101142 RepID=A0A8H7SJP9_9FUNG|nr:hypothetical protein INT48_003574 [Thamnidium elegans]KAI8091550.1 hypothetical protein BDF21DRAFT_409660 [Thamnidium elegans]